MGEDGTIIVTVRILQTVREHCFAPPQSVSGARLTLDKISLQVFKASSIHDST